MGYNQFTETAPKMYCTNCGKEIKGTALMVQDRPYCCKICILKEKVVYCLCGNSTKNPDGVCDTCRLIDKITKEGREKNERKKE